MWIEVAYVNCFLNVQLAYVIKANIFRGGSQEGSAVVAFFEHCNRYCIT